MCDHKERLNNSATLGQKTDHTVDQTNIRTIHDHSSNSTCIFCFYFIFEKEGEKTETVGKVV